MPSALITTGYYGFPIIGISYLGSEYFSDAIDATDCCQACQDAGDCPAMIFNASRVDGNCIMPNTPCGQEAFAYFDSPTPAKDLDHKSKLPVAVQTGCGYIDAGN
jgi:hypothetical protein